MTNTALVKKCSKCKEEMSIEKFYADTRYKLGVRGACKICMNKDSSSRHIVKKEENFKKQYIYKKNNPEKVKGIHKKWSKNNRPKVNAVLAKYRATKLNATPSWLSAIEKAQIQEIYDIALAKTVQNGILYEVDHIHPLQGDGVTGLHVPWNLQVLTMSDNRSKQNRLDGKK